MANEVTVKKPPRERAPRISPKLRKAIEALASGRFPKQTDAAKFAGLTSEHLCRELARPHVRAYLDKRTADLLAAGKVRASQRLMELVDADSEHVSFDAARHVLAIQGIKPAESPMVVNNVNVIAGYVIDLSGEGPVVGTRHTDEQ